MSNTVIAFYSLRRPLGMVPKVYIEQLSNLADHANRHDQSAFSTDNPCFSQEAVARKAYEDLMELSESMTGFTSPDNQLCQTALLEFQAIAKR